MAYYLNSYKPLQFESKGRKALKKHGLPPFLDYSCRKEPDFLSEHPSITALCRADKFVPRLHVGDAVVSITRKRDYFKIGVSHWRLTAVLDVIERLESHSEAAEWYRSRGIALPNNCMVPGNPPTPIEQTAPVTEFGRDLRRWDLSYKQRARATGTFLICNKTFLELHEPPVVTEANMMAIFGRIPGTQNPPQISKEEYEGLLALI